MTAQFLIAFIVVLALIGLAFWLLRRFNGNRLGAGANRGRMPRLAVVDAAAVDGRRRLVLVRRDNIEHLIMIGGPSDIVVEPNIVRATPPQQQMPPRSALPPASEQAWTDEPVRPEPLEYNEPAPLPEPPPRPARPAFAEEMRRAPAPERRTEPLAGFPPEPMARAEREPPRAAPRAEPRAEPPPLTPPPLAPRPLRPEPPKAPPPVRAPERAAPASERVAAPPPPTPAAAGSAADKNLAEMAQRLEAALRRPGANPREAAPPVAPEAPPPRAPRQAPPELPAAAEEGEAKPTGTTQFKNLEDEMASLLGRPKTPS